MMDPINHTVRRNIFFHSLCWVIYIGYEVFFSVVIYHANSSPASYLFFYLCNIGIFYWHFHILNYYLNKTGSRYFLMLFMVVIELCTVLTLKITFDYFTMKTASVNPVTFLLPFVFLTAASAVNLPVNMILNF